MQTLSHKKRGAYEEAKYWDLYHVFMHKDLAISWKVSMILNYDIHMEKACIMSLTNPLHLNQLRLALLPTPSSPTVLRMSYNVFSMNDHPAM